MPPPGQSSRVECPPIPPAEMRPRRPRRAPNLSGPSHRCTNETRLRAQPPLPATHFRSPAPLQWCIAPARFDSLSARAMPTAERSPMPRGMGRQQPKTRTRRCGRGCRLAAMLVAFLSVAWLRGDRGRSALGPSPQRTAPVSLGEGGALSQPSAGGGASIAGMWMFRRPCEAGRAGVDSGTLLPGPDVPPYDAPPVRERISKPVSSAFRARS
jgi:hypothetical protein